MLWDSTPFDANVARLTDADGDGVTLAEGDCNDADPATHPGAADPCDGADNDCDGEVDEEVPDVVWCQDVDGDGFGDPAWSARTCFPESGWVQDCTDCDDAVRAVNLEATEACNGVDDNCDGETDPPDAAGAQDWYPDQDGDAYGAATESTRSCDAPAGSILDNSDCDDTRDDTYPGAPEICADGRVNDCGGTGETCGWSGERALDSEEDAFIAGPEANYEYLGYSLSFVDANADGVDDLMFSGFGAMYGERTMGALHVWHGAPSGLRAVEEAHADLLGGPYLALGLCTSGSPAIRVPDDGTGGSVILVATGGFSDEFDVDGVVLAAGEGIYGTTSMTTANIFARGRSEMESFGSTLATSASLLEGASALVVGAPYNAERGTSGGAIYVGTVREPDADDAIAVIAGEGEEMLGIRILPETDVTGDGIADLIAGTSYLSGVTPTVYVFPGPLSGSLTSADGEVAATHEDWWPDSTTLLPDLDDDGLLDLAVGGVDTVTLVSGRTLAGAGALEVMAEVVDDGRTPMGSGFAIQTGDLGADGVPDLVVASPFLNTPADAGAVGEAGGVAIVPLDRAYAGEVNLWEVATAAFYGPDEGAHLGMSVALGDANGDGYTDMLLGAPDWSANGYVSSGGVWFILGGGI